MAATTNGTLTPPRVRDAVAPSTDTTALKRKRESGSDADTTAAPKPPSSDNKQIQYDILEVLQQYDTTPSFLSHALDETSEPALKKAKVEGESKSTSISAKLASGAYVSLPALKEDAIRASQAIVSEIRSRTKNGQERLVVEDLKSLQKVKAFEELLTEVVDKEATRSNLRQTDRAETQQELGHGDTGAVLTLFGNAPTPKQLFSSTPSGKVKLPVEEMSLPNGFTATKIMPAPFDDTRKGPTFEDTFPPPYNLPSLHPPKSHKRSATRDTTLTWEFKEPLSRNSKKGGYTVQSLSVGDWLGYGGVDSEQDAASPREKRKQRDRALSSSDGQKQRPSRTSMEEAEAKEEDALFRRAYSSFLPSHDNSKSLVPAQTKSMVWWYRVGEKKFRERFGQDPAVSSSETAVDAALDGLTNGISAPNTLALENGGATEEGFDRIVEQLDEWDEEVLGTSNIEQLTSGTDVDNVLHQISVLLETLASYQTIRNSALPSSTPASRTPISPGPTLSSRIGKPDEPSQDEIETYKTLRHELAYLILKLPPYTIAKVDGDQLAELGVSKLIQFGGKDVKGTMEEDQVARLAKYTAMATAAGIATLTRGSSTSSQHYSSTAQRTPAIGQAANTRYGQSSQYGAARTPTTSSQYQRSTSTQSQYGTPSATAPRASYGQQPNQYARQGLPQASYGQTNGQQYYQQRPQQTTGGYGSYSQQYGQTPQSQQRPSSYAGAQNAQWPSRTQPVNSHATNAVSYQVNAGTQSQSQTHSTYNRTDSPVKSAGYGQIPQQQHLTGSQQRPSYAQALQPQHPSSDRGTPNYPSNPQTPVNGALHPRPPPQNIAPRAASGTPQPPPTYEHQQTPKQANGTS